MVLSLGIEALLIVVGGLRVPEDNAQIAPVILWPAADTWVKPGNSDLRALRVLCGE